MKVLHISSPKTWRGGEQQLIYLAEELKSKGIEQVIMCPFNSEVHRYCLKHHLPHVTYFKGFSANPMVAFRVTHVCKREGIDLIHVHDSHAHNFSILSSVLSGNDVPIIVSRRVDFAPQTGSLSKFKYNHPQIKKIVCVSEAIKQIMVDSIESPEKLEVVHSGVDLSRFEDQTNKGTLRAEFEVPDDHVIIGNVAALAPHKDYPTFIKTVKELLQRGLKARFFAIGEGPNRKEIEQLIKDEGLESDIILTGFRRDVVDLLAELDVFLITSETEGLGTSILDALASKAPVVATDAGGIGEIIKNGVSGVLCPVKDAVALADGVMSMLEDSDLKNRCIAGGTERLQAFTKSSTAAKTLKIYEEVLGSSSSTME